MKFNLPCSSWGSHSTCSLLIFLFICSCLHTVSGQQKIVIEVGGIKELPRMRQDSKVYKASKDDKIMITCSPDLNLSPKGEMSLFRSLKTDAYGVSVGQNVYKNDAHNQIFKFEQDAPKETKWTSNEALSPKSTGFYKCLNDVQKSDVKMIIFCPEQSTYTVEIEYNGETYTSNEDVIYDGTAKEIKCVSRKGLDYQRMKLELGDLLLKGTEDDSGEDFDRVCSTTYTIPEDLRELDNKKLKCNVEDICMSTGISINFIPKIAFTTDAKNCNTEQEISTGAPSNITCGFKRYESKSVIPEGAKIVVKAIKGGESTKNYTLVVDAETKWTIDKEVAGYTIEADPTVMAETNKARGITTVTVMYEKPGNETVSDMSYTFWYQESVELVQMGGEVKLVERGSIPTRTEMEKTTSPAKSDTTVTYISSLLFLLIHALQ